MKTDTISKQWVLNHHKWRFRWTRLQALELFRQAGHRAFILQRSCIRKLVVGDYPTMRIYKSGVGVCR